MSDQWQQSERVSALMDGQLRGEEFASTVDFLADEPEARDTWDTYHLVGEAMRSAGAPLRTHNPDFVARLRQELAKNTLEDIASNSYKSGVEVQDFATAPVANDAWWKRVAGLASLAFVGVVVWQGAGLLSVGTPQQAAEQVAQLPAPPAQTVPAALVTADGTSALMIRDPQLDALLAAHRQLGGATALQMPSGFLRNATFNEGKR